MRWILRFALWSLATTLLLGLAAEPYRRGLAAATTTVLGWLGHRVELHRLEVLSPYHLALFGALALATTNSAWGSRLRALALGLPCLAVLDSVSVTLGVGSLLVQAAHGPPAATLARLGGWVMTTLPWVSAIVLWLILLGHHALRPRGPLRASLARAPVGRA